MSRNALTSILLGLLVLFAPGGHRAGETSALSGEPRAQGQEPEKPRPKTVINSAHALSWEEGDVTVMFLTGGVTVNQPDTKIHAQRAMLWKAKDSPESYDEIYAEGNVIFSKGIQSLNCERFYFNRITGLGAVVDVRLKAHSKELKEDFFVMAKEARINGKDMQKMVADDVFLTSCSYEVPHYHLSVGHSTLLGSDKEPAQKHDRFGFSPFGDDWTVDFDELVPEFSGFPFLYIPGLSVGPWLMNFPIRAIRFGHSSQFGNYLYSDFGSHIRLKDEKGKTREWGDVALKVDYRQVRGEAGGLDLHYKWDDYTGYLDSYFLHDLGRRPGFAFDAQFPPLEHPDRGKLHWFHRQDLDTHWRYELEVNYLSDRNLLQEFFPHEFQELKEPETAAYLRWMDGNMGAYLLGRVRINKFQSQDEYLPRVDFNLLSHPILPGIVDNLYLTERVDTVDIRHESDQALQLASVDTWRVDAVTELRMPFEFRYFQISPFIQNRFTFYQEDLAGDSRARDMWTSGTRLTTQIHATHPEIMWEKVGIRGIRHVIEIEARYANTFVSNVDPADLFPYEPVDQLSRFEEAAFEIRQRFLTKDSTNHPFEFLSLSFGMEYYPNSLRDTTTFNVNNSVPPFSWIPILADPSTGLFPRRNWSAFNYDFTLTPRSFFSMTGYGEYDFLTHTELSREVALTLTPDTSFSFTVSQVMLKGVANAYSLWGTWALTPKWSVSVGGQYDFKAGDYTKQSLVVARNFHDFAVEVVVERDFTRNDNRVFAAFIPKFLGQSSQHRSHLYQPGVRSDIPTDR